MEDHAELAARWLDHRATGWTDDHDWTAVRLVDAIVRRSADEGLSVVIALVRQARSQEDLFSIAAGPLQDLLRLHGPAIVDALLESARMDQNLRTAVGGVWGNSIGIDVWRRLQAFVESTD